MNEILTFDKVQCHKGGQSILEDITFSVNRGEVITVLGPSGSGKSTLLRLAIALDERSGGQVFFHGKSVDEWNLAALRRRMGLVLQLPFLFAGTVRENLLYAPRIHKKFPDDEVAFVHELLTQVGLPNDLANRNTNDLSVGQQMRVSFARTLANRPEILLLDEPSASLDAQAEQHVLELIQTLHQQEGFTIVCVTHKVDTARALGGRSLLLQEGRIEREGFLEEWIQDQPSLFFPPPDSGNRS